MTEDLRAMVTARPATASSNEVTMRELHALVCCNGGSFQQVAEAILRTYELRRRPPRTGSYPFLDTARDRGVSYAEVLAVADRLKNNTAIAACPLEYDIRLACRAEARRREEARR